MDFTVSSSGVWIGIRSTQQSVHEKAQGQGAEKLLHLARPFPMHTSIVEIFGLENTVFLYSGSIKFFFKIKYFDIYKNKFLIKIIPVLYTR